MLLRKLFNPPETLSLRLTFWYTILFSISSFLAFAIFYMIISSVMTKQIDDELIDDVNEYKAMLKEEGLDEIRQEVIKEAETDGVEKVFFCIFNQSGTMIASSDLSGWGSTGQRDKALQSIRNGLHYYFEDLPKGSREHSARTIYGNINPNLILQIGLTFEEKDTFLELVQIIFFFTLMIITLLAGIMGFFLTRHSLAGVKEVTHAADEISRSGIFDKRVSIKNRGEEIEKLSSTFNTMLDRIQCLVSGIKEMSDNIAHDLKTPITRIRTIAELTLTGSETLTEFKDMAGDTIEECDRLIDMVNSMLYISDGEAGVSGLEMLPVDLSEIVQDACDLFKPIAEDGSVKLFFSSDKQYFINGNIQNLQRMVANILDNAIKYTPPHGMVVTTLTEDAENTFITFKDSGIGIHADDLPDIFKRFFRSDKSRTGSGSGLGLSLARMIAINHSGEISVESLINEGSTFVISIPKLSSRQIS